MRTDDHQVLGGRYEVEARLGAGGMAEVWKGRDRVLNRTVAIKTLLPQFARDGSFVDRFRREAQAAARLNHPGIVSVYDSGDGDDPFIVMQYIEGRTLADFLASGKNLQPMQAAQIAQEIAEALDAAHAHGVIHRDIKPANVMVTRDGKVLVMDFGIARLIAGPETAPQTSAVMGTASYLSPEQAQGQAVDARTDIYSLGVVLYEMLTGRPPFTGDSPMAIAYKQVNAMPPTPSSLNPDVPPELDAVVMRALSKNPANRYQTGAEFAEDLERARTGGQVMATPLLPVGGEATQVISRPQPTSVLPPTEDEPGGSKKAWTGALLAILIMALLAAGAYLIVTMLTDDGGPELVTMPNLVGKERAEAEERLNELGLTYEIERRRTEEEEPGIVLDQRPDAGNSVDPAATEEDPVTIVVSQAPRTFVVPNLEGMTVEEAEAALAAAHLVLGEQTTQNDQDIPEGQIISQSPAAGDEAPRDTPVNVVVSAGPSVVIVPDVTCLSFANAKTQLTGLGLQVQLGDRVTPNADCPTEPELIAAQDTSPGSQVDPGTTIVLHKGLTPSPSPSPTPSPTP
ncbi:MAG TPA: Stk1 family PASTA domain-containing Ser/Thr kinase [Actinomycetota bacterium]|nr:Stk1 family PASTA domain-containing Ser/Thr kinase [Actinomycetota bacterium]